MTTQHISLGELIAAIPLVIDTTPTECVVALSVNAQGLPTCALVVPRATLLDPICAGATAAAVAEELAMSGAQLAVLVSYSGDDIRDGCAALDVLALEAEFAAPRVEQLAVKGDTWFRPGCHDAECCPPEGRALPPVPAELPAILAAARARAHAAPHTSPRVFNAAMTRWEERVSAVSAWGEALATGAVPDAATARRLAAALDDLCVRDWVVLTILGADEDAADDALAGFESGAVGLALDAALGGSAVPDPLVTERARAVVDRVARGARGRHRKAAAHTLAGVLEWWEGNLARAKERCQEALASDADYRLAVLVGLAASRGIEPGWVRTVGQTAH